MIIKYCLYGDNDLSFHSCDLGYKRYGFIQKDDHDVLRWHHTTTSR